MTDRVAPARHIAQVRFGAATSAVSYFDRPGRDGAHPTIVFVHGLGNGAENFAAMYEEPALVDHRLIAMDLPGCGESPYPADRALSIDDLVDLLEAFVEERVPDPFVLVGASMGGLIALLYAERRPERVAVFVNAEGNLAPEDCMFSRRVVANAFPEFVAHEFPKINADLEANGGRGHLMHKAVLARASPRAYYDFSFQTVEYSDHGALLDRFLALPIARLYFIYGSLNAGLSYLPRLRESRCVLTEIAGAGHFMFYDDPRAFAECISRAASAPSRKHLYGSRDGGKHGAAYVSAVSAAGSCSVTAVASRGSARRSRRYENRCPSRRT
jgi:pimeloyl-ACP methyl ester carboxylesterase